ncbi:hypothetical protein, partial [Candidatus Solincola tengchongensis]|uniref:hypothetical protein n=1 Tax=Candidatus Solincola tengchongensis TaxID=2900693 RepID=UPI00257F9AE3
WERTFGGEGWDRGYSLAITADGGYLLAGDTDSSGAGLCDVYLVKVDADGNRLWSETYGGSGYDWAYSVQETTDGSFLLAGQTESLGSPSGIYLLKTDAQGTLLWQKKVDLGGTSLANGVEAAPDGGYVLCGWVVRQGKKDMDACLVKVDRDGNVLWQRFFGGGGDDWWSSVKAVPGAGYVLAGGTTSRGSGKYDAYLVMTDEQGELLWERTFGGEGDDYAHGVCVLEGGGFALAGSVWSAASGDDAYLAITDEEGNALLERTYGGGGGDWAYSVIPVPDGGLVLVGGCALTPDRGEDVFLVKVSAGEV